MRFKQLIAMMFRQVNTNAGLMAISFSLLLTVAALMSTSVSVSAQSRNDDNDGGWLKIEPLNRNFDLTIGNEDWLQQPKTNDPWGAGDSHAMMAPPDPNSQIPLTGFDWMLLASFAFGAWWLVRQVEKGRLTE